jgi:hypothetical protein
VRECSLPWSAAIRSKDFLRAADKTGMAKVLFWGGGRDILAGNGVRYAQLFSLQNGA